MNFKDYFEKEFQIKINNTKFFDEALTHNSYSNEHKIGYTYQRLEFLGDAILEKYTSLYLFKKYQNEGEGVMTKTRSSMVREETLGNVMVQIGLNKFIRLGNGEEASGGRKKLSILADVFEAIIAAIYLDNENFNPDQKVDMFLERTLIEYISKPEYLESIRDYKSELQELLQAENRNDLKYVVLKERTLKGNVKEYTIAVELEGQVYGKGIGSSKQQAEQQAAKNCLSKLYTKTKSSK